MQSLEDTRQTRLQYTKDTAKKANRDGSINEMLYRSFASCFECKTWYKTIEGWTKIVIHDSGNEQRVFTCSETCLDKIGATYDAGTEQG